ncbi:hypothetical protein Barb6_03894 [Bacteroidales bacterium Barb6]|nr:hypothetical protein Barb6_03894 [Bacteroidales bacterium Barb6]
MSSIRFFRAGTSFAIFVFSRASQTTFAFISCFLPSQCAGFTVSSLLWKSWTLRPSDSLKRTFADRTDFFDTRMNAVTLAIYCLFLRCANIGYLHNTNARI